MITMSSLPDGSRGECTGRHCALRDAVAIASAADTIEIGPTGMITLSLGQLTIAEDLHIEGPSADDLTISGADAARVFWISEDANAEISGVAVAHGRGRDGSIFNRGGPLALSHSMLAENRSKYHGGAVSNRFDHTLKVSKTVFSGTATRDGATIDNGEELTASYCIFKGRDASTWGGGIYSLRGTGKVTVSSCEVNGYRRGRREQQRRGVGNALYLLP